MTEPGTRARLSTFLAAHSTLTLATLGTDGQPMAASLFFAAADDLSLYWTSSPNSRHSRNLERQPWAAVTVHGAAWSWGEIAGVQMEGQAAVILPGPDWQAAWDLYLGKFEFVKDFQAEVSRSNFYRFTPAWARLIDNSFGFGHKEELTLP